MGARPLLLGHRGARRDAPENTLEAFDLCLRHGCDGFEFDVRLCADGHAVICHDPKLAGRNVSKTRFQDLNAPSLEDVFARYASRAFLDIELKVAGLESTVIELLRKFPPRRGYCVSSFLPPIVERLHQLDKTLELGLICRTRAQLAGWTATPVQSLFLEADLCTASVGEALHRSGKRVYVWTVNRPNEMRVFAGMGVDGIISDDSALLVRTLSGGQPESGGRDQES